MYSRIISLAPSISETICKLGKEDLLVGVTDYCNYPDYCTQLPKIGGFANPNIENILSLKPDCIIATTMHNTDKLKIFKDNNIQIEQIKASHITDSPSAIRKLGRLLNEEEKANYLALEIEQQINSTFEKAKNIKTKPKVCYLCTSMPFCSYKSKCQTNQLIDILGGYLVSYDKDNIIDSMISNNTEVIIIPYKEESEDYKRQWNFIENNPEIKKTKAFKNNKIVSINGELLSRPGPRVGLGLKQLYNLIHSLKI